MSLFNLLYLGERIPVLNACLPVNILVSDSKELSHAEIKFSKYVPFFIKLSILGVSEVFFPQNFLAWRLSITIKNILDFMNQYTINNNHISKLGLISYY